MYTHWMMLLFLPSLPGLLGGAVYVNAFTLLSKDVPPALREFSLAAASLADSVGIALADIAGILVQVGAIAESGHRLFRLGPVLPAVGCASRQDATYARS